MSGEIEKLRGEIDALDDELLALVNRRAELARRIGGLKQGAPAYRPERETGILRRIAERNPGPLPAERAWLRSTGRRSEAASSWAISSPMRAPRCSTCRRETPTPPLMLRRLRNSLYGACGMRRPSCRGTRGAEVTGCSSISPAVRTFSAGRSSCWPTSIIDCAHSVSSPLGAWMILALTAPAARGAVRDELEEILGTNVKRARKALDELLADPPDAIRTAVAMWGLEQWPAPLPRAVATGPVPTQAQADAWARDHTDGLITRFPVAVSGMAAVLAKPLDPDELVAAIKRHVRP